PTGAPPMPGRTGGSLLFEPTARAQPSEDSRGLTPPARQETAETFVSPAPTPLPSTTERRDEKAPEPLQEVLTAAQQAIQSSAAPPPSSPEESKGGGTTSTAIQLHDSYLVLETSEGMLVIDQHALHERILFEQLRRRIRAG